MLTKNQLKQLRNEICMNSIFLKDYSNSLFIKEKTVKLFFDSFMDYIYEEYSNGLNYYDVIDAHDNIDDLYNYYIGFDDDPLLQDDYIAYKHLNNSDGIVIYLIDDYILYPTVKTAFMNSNLFNGCFNTRITENRLYESKNNGYYFIKNHQRYYINDFMRV